MRTGLRIWNGSTAAGVTMCSSCSGDYENPDMTAEESICEECDHPISLHSKDGCEYEADRPDSDIGQVAWRCGCKAVTHD